MKNIADTTDFCRTCFGRGYTIDRLEAGRTLAEPCKPCAGTGHRTVQVFEAGEVAA
jgi:DnaJ-class molecular chaperone